MSWEDKKERNPWINRFEEVLLSEFNNVNQEILNSNGYNFSKTKINDDFNIYFAVDKIYTINNKKLWVLYLPVPNGYDSIGIKTDDNKNNSRVLKFNLIKYKNNNHSEIFDNNNYSYRGLYYWLNSKRSKDDRTVIVHNSIRFILNSQNDFINNYVIVSSAINRTNQQGWNNLGNINNLWLINANAHNLNEILRLIVN